MFTFQIPGDPKPAPRPRFAIRKKKDGSSFGKVYRDQDYQNEKEKIGLLAKVAMGGSGPITGKAVTIIVRFMMGPPAASCSKKEVERRLAAGHIQKPDVDNLLKTVMDACNGICWQDDSQVAAVCATKEWSDSPATIVSVATIGFPETGLIPFATVPLTKSAGEQDEQKSVHDELQLLQSGS